MVVGRVGAKPAIGECRSATIVEHASTYVDCEVVAELTSRYSNRMILFDAPPVLVSSESSVLALHVGQIVFVVEAFRTAEAEVRAALEMVSFCDNVGLVLNNSGLHPSTGEFGSYYQARSI